MGIFIPIINIDISCDRETSHKSIKMGTRGLFLAVPDEVAPYVVKPNRDIPIGFYYVGAVVAGEIAQDHGAVAYVNSGRLAVPPVGGVWGSQRLNAAGSS